MVFSEFAKKLFSVLSGGDSAETFTKTIFDALVTDEGRPFVEEKKDSSYKAYFYGTSQITKFARSINTHIDKLGFFDFLDSYDEAVAENLCIAFSDDFPDATTDSIKEKLADCFVEIVTSAAQTTKKRTNDKTSLNGADVIKIGEEFIKKHLNDVILSQPINDEPFDKYLKQAKEYYSTKKTLLYAEEPRPFYDIYVCSNLKYNNLHLYDSKNPKTRTVIEDATIMTLLPPYEYMIINGTGGSGKSMFMTHLLLSFDSQKDERCRTPIFVQLKDYARQKEPLTELISDSAKAFNDKITEDMISQASSEGRLILLLDGLDEIPSRLRQSFNKALENYIKSYPEINIIMTSRPFYSFASYTKFAIFDLQELSKEQSIELINKLEFWNTKTKEKFLVALEKRLYTSHHQFASNPLLLTIMLMTYASFGEVPAKMHHFYAQAYETMARLHDASKGSFVRPLHTNITPEEFSDYFAQFCARTYCDELVEFDERTFTDYMKKVIKDINSPTCTAQPHDFLLDLTENLCIMYREGEKYYFIHRSFQEYFAALFFSSYYDEKLERLGKFFESKRHRFMGDIAFDMLFDMIPEKIERFVFLPYLEALVTQIKGEGKEAYWSFLLLLYPVIGYETGWTDEGFTNEPESFLYEKLVTCKKLKRYDKLDDFKWPEKLFKWYTTKNWCEVYSYFLNSKAYEEYSDQDEIDSSITNNTSLVDFEDVPYDYIERFGSPDIEGTSVELEIKELLERKKEYKEVVAAMENESFPLMQEFLGIKAYLGELRLRNQKIEKSDSLFDD